MKGKGLLFDWFYRHANHSDFCGFIPIFKSDFRIMISDIKILANNNFKMVRDKIKEVAPPCTPMWRKLYLSPLVKLGCFPLRTRLVFVLFIGKM